jgi:hypothetical protein
LFFRYNYESEVERSLFSIGVPLIDFLIPGLFGELGTITSFVDLELERSYCFILFTLPDLSVVRCDCCFDLELYGEVV